MTKIKLWAASLVQMWDECPRCFWRRYVLNERRPNTFAEVFDIADTAMRERIAGAENDGWVDVGVGPQRMRMHSQAVWVESQPIAFQYLGVALVLAGKYDAIVEDEDGSRYLVDYKTSAKPDHELYRYRRQLDAYRFCLEHPAKGAAMVIDETGLLVYTPQWFAFKNRVSGLYGPTRWIDFAREDTAFLRYLRAVATLLSHDEPMSELACEWCKYRNEPVGLLRVSNAVMNAPYAGFNPASAQVAQG
jgi:hypothetical protein